MDRKDDRGFGEMLIQGLEEAIAFERGELKDVRVHRRDVPESSDPSDDADGGGEAWKGK